MDGGEWEVVLTLVGGNSEVIDVNDAGQVMGRVSGPEDHGFSWTPAGGMIDFGPSSQVTAVSEAGQVVGCAPMPEEREQGRIRFHGRPQAGSSILAHPSILAIVCTSARLA